MIREFSEFIGSIVIDVPLAVAGEAAGLVKIVLNITRPPTVLRSDYAPNITYVVQSPGV